MAKLVRCLVGEIFDVVVDIRKNSPTFRQWWGVSLSADNKKQLLIEPGFAHGFCVVSEVAEVEYKCSEYYSSTEERGILWNDPAMGIKWPIDQPLLSDKDNRFPRLKDQPDLM
jgi:dTDP-4-dehydrorhamnose 3,5-epimerase